VVAAAHIADDFPELERAFSALPDAGRLRTVHADIRKRDDCERIVEAALSRLGGLHILVNNAGLIFTFIYPGRHLRTDRPKFWETTDDIVQAVLETNYIAHDRMTRLCVGHLMEQGWGRIINVTTRLETMNRDGTSPYGASKAALEMSSEVWMKDLEGTGVTVNILNPGGAVDTLGFATPEERAAVVGRIPMMDPDKMRAPVVWLASERADAVNGHRLDAENWDETRPPEEEARRWGRPLGFLLKPHG
jgi:NAD(P)-dependent dehydrogenase (short-subunit alcohol dehydrogenase family)